MLIVYSFSIGTFIGVDEDVEDDDDVDDDAIPYF
jgi:hypothetical protein